MDFRGTASGSSFGGEEEGYIVLKLPKKTWKFPLGGAWGSHAPTLTIIPPKKKEKIKIKNKK